MSTVNEKMTAIADNIRSYTGETEKLSLDDMAENIEKVYEAGQNSGGNYEEIYLAGQKSIFERIQDGNKTQNYCYAFAYDRFDDTNFFPVGPIKCSNGTTPGQYMFYNATGLTDTKVEIVANNNNINYAFNLSGLVTIRKLTVYESTTFTNTFTHCDDLINILFGGTIGKAISFKDSSKLSDESVDSIIEHLKDLTGATALTLTVHTDVYNRIVSSGKDALITAKNWSLAKA